MAFGVTGGSTEQISRTQNYSAEVAYMQDNMGKKVKAHTYGAELEIQEEFYETTSKQFSNQATGGQEGTDVCTANSLTESNSDYAKISVTRKVLPDAAAYSGGTASGSGQA